MLKLTQGLFIAAVAAFAASPAVAQINGPPIAPDQVLRSQPTTVTPLPPSPSIASPSPASPSVGAGSVGGGGASRSGGRAPRVERSQDRVRDCQHQAALEGVPRSRRGSYVHTCVQGN